MTYKRINNIAGWIVFTLASAVYLLTMEATGSFWDCGEFASSANKVQIPHPPGAPLFVLIGRLFMAPISDPHSKILGINSMSALCSGFTILFLFWSITYLAKKIVQKGNEALTNDQIFMILMAGLVGAGCYTFCDSFWYSAVESEVYAMSSFFTAITFWAILKWECAVTEEQAMGINGKFTDADRWLIVIFYLMGLAIGVHLLNLLTIPSIVMIYYFKRYKPTTWGTIIAFVVGCFITGFVQKAIIQWTVKAAGNFDISFVNDLHLPFFSGFAFYYILLAAFIAIGLLFKRDKFDKTKFGIWLFLFLALLIFPSGMDSFALKAVLMLGVFATGLLYVKPETLAGLKLYLWILAVMVLGTTSYFTTLIRSNADPAVDMYNVDNPVSLVGYLSRDQYGDWPIMYGQDFTAQPEDMTVDNEYVKDTTGYSLDGQKATYIYSSEDQHVFPRVWDNSNDQHHADYYAGFLGITKDPKTGQWSDTPTMFDNIKFFIGYQFDWMYLRYFMWNFAGKQNDVQGVDMPNLRDGNWKTGIPIWDNLRLDNQDAMPDSMKRNKSNNNLYALPLILGLLGFFYQLTKNRGDAIVVGLLFFFTGLAIGLYLNMPGNQPRERDYAFAGSFYAYAIWVGLGVLMVRDMFQKFMSSKTANYAAALLCILAVPVLMGAQEWDDHDRSKKTIARDLAIDYLQSCAPNAILVTFGDNDTYPLWYAQEVEGIRRDVRVINNSLMGTDWYLNQLRYKVNQSDPIDPLWTAQQMIGARRDEIVYSANSTAVAAGGYMDLYTMMHDWAGSDDPDKVQQQDKFGIINTYPSKNVSVPVDIALVRANGTVNPNDSVVPSMNFTIPKNAIFKNESAVLNIIAANKWKRPIYFTSDYTDLGFGSFLRQDGLTYRLVPVQNDPFNEDWMYDKMMHQFAFGNCNVPGVYYDEENRRHLLTIRMAFAQIAGDLADHDRKADAVRLLERCDSNMLQQNFPYGMVSRFQQHNYISTQFLEACYKAGDSTLAAKVTRSLATDLQQQMTYYAALDDDDKDAMRQETGEAQELLKGIEDMAKQFQNPQPAMLVPPPVTAPKKKH